MTFIKSLVTKPKGKRLLSRMPWLRWEGNIKKDLKDIVSEVADWIYLAQDRAELWALVNTVINLVAHRRRGIS
jgi:hypothetical protein